MASPASIEKYLVNFSMRLHRNDIGAKQMRNGNWNKETTARKGRSFSASTASRRKVKCTVTHYGNGFMVKTKVAY